MKLLALPLGKIRLDGGTQPRLAMDWDAVEEYAEAKKAGAEFPAIIVFWDAVHYWLASGFHRYHAHQKAGAKHINCDVRDGSLRDAILFAVGENDRHGVRRTIKDKHRACRLLLEDPVWREWNDNEIGRRCRVSNHLAAKVRKEVLQELANSPDNHVGKFHDGKRRKANKHGKQITQVARKQQGLTGEALARQIQANERQAAFRNLERLSPELREWLEVLGEDPDAEKARQHHAACVSSWETVRRKSMKQAA